MGDCPLDDCSVSAGRAAGEGNAAEAGAVTVCTGNGDAATRAEANTGNSTVLTADGDVNDSLAAATVGERVD